MTLNEVLLELGIYQSRDENWDGYGASPFDHRMLNLVKAYCISMDRRGFTTLPGPCSDGAVELDMTNGREGCTVTFHPGYEIQIETSGHWEVY